MKTYTLSEAASALGISQKELSYIVNRGTDFYKKRARGSGFNYYFTEEDLALIGRYLAAKKAVQDCLKEIRE